MPKAPGSRCRTSSNGTLCFPRLGQSRGNGAHDGHALGGFFLPTTRRVSEQSVGDEAAQEQQQHEPPPPPTVSPTRLADLPSPPPRAPATGRRPRSRAPAELPDDEDHRYADPRSRRARDVRSSRRASPPCSTQASTKQAATRSPEHRRQLEQHRGCRRRRSVLLMHCSVETDPSGPMINWRERAEQQVGHGRQQQGVQPVHRREPGDLGERHCRRARRGRRR